MIPVKLVCVGPHGGGKTSTLISYTSGAFPGDYIPTVFDNYSANVMVDGRPINLGLWDVYTTMDTARLRVLSYPETDIFLMCFDISDEKSLAAIIDTYEPEVREFDPAVPRFLVGLKSDLRDEGNPIPVGKLQDVALDFGVPYYELSARTQHGMKDLFDDAVRVALQSKGHFGEDPPRRFCCSLL